MRKRKHTPEQIVRKLREAEVTIFSPFNFARSTASPFTQLATVIAGAGSPTSRSGGGAIRQTPTRRDSAP